MYRSKIAGKKNDLNMVRKKSKSKNAAKQVAQPSVTTNSKGNQNRLMMRNQRAARGFLPGPNKSRFPGQLVNAGGSLVQMPDLTHTLTLEDRTFLANILDPCDERLGPSSASKIPDGTLPNSGINGFREAFNVSPPFVIPTDPGPIGGPVWTLALIRLPTIRTAIFMLASNTRDEFAVADQDLFANAVNSSLVTEFPTWYSLTTDNTLRATRVMWSQLANVIGTGSLNRLFNQVRITKFGMTSYHNAPDLYNQGMVMTAQWNCDDSSRDHQELELSVNTPVTLPFVVSKSAVNVLTGGSLFLPTRDLRILPLFQLAGSTTNVETEIESVSELGFTGFVTVGTGDRVEIRAGDAIRGSVLFDNSGGTNLHIFTITVIRPNGSSESTQQGTNNNSNQQVTLNVVWEVTGTVVDAKTNDVELPPLTTQSIIQSTPKAVYLPMKEFNGAYNAGRWWEPVFGMQEADNQGPLRLRRRGGSFPSNLTLVENGDLLDLNFGTVVQIITGLSLAASVAVKIAMDIEFVAGEDSPWQGFMNPNESVDTQVISIARAIALEQPFAYPQTYNSLGTLLDGISSLVSQVPVIGHIAPLVTRVVKAISGSEPSGPAKMNCASELDPDHLAQLLKGVLSKLGL